MHHTIPESTLNKAEGSGLEGHVQGLFNLPAVGATQSDFKQVNLCEP